MATRYRDPSAKENAPLGQLPVSKNSTIVQKRVLVPVVGKAKPVLATRAALGAIDHNQKNVTKPLIKAAVKAAPTTRPEPNHKLAPSLEIDQKCASDPQQVSEYAQDIQAYLLSIESHYMVNQWSLLKHSTTPRMRSILIEWMMSAHEHFSLTLETLHLSVWIVDKYLEKNKDVGTSTLQLVGTTAMFIASKYEEIYVQPLGDFAYICDDMFKKRDILKMEMSILSCLSMQLGRPHSVIFLRRYSKIAKATLEQHTLAKYLLELALLDYKLVAVKPSIQAASALTLSLAILTTSQPATIWSSQLVAGSSYEYDDFKSIVGRMAKLLLYCDKDSKLTNKDFKYEGVQQKYSKCDLLKISLSHKIRGPFVNSLVSKSAD